MNVRNCKRCGKMFNYIVGDPICPECKAKLEEKFQEVKKFVQENKTAAMQEICDTCDVDSKLVKQWVREERLQFTESSQIKISCEMCGASIITGRFCDACKQRTMNNISNAGRRTERPNTDGGAPKGGGRANKMYTFGK